MKDNRMKDALENIARRGVPENTNVWPGISARLERKSFMLTLRSRPLVAIILALLILLVLSGVVYAIGHSLGYIPGIGLIDQSAPIRVLAEPVTITQGGVTLKVEEAILSADKTVIKFSVDNVLIINAASRDATQCNDGSLILPDGSSLKIISGFGMDSWGTGFEDHFNFEPVPSGVNEAILIPPCIQGYLPDENPENWKLPLRFIPAPPEMTVMPVIEVTPSPQASTENPLTLEKVIETDGGYILAGTFSSVSLPLDAKAMYFGEVPTITDASGQNIPFEFANYQLDLPSQKTQEGVFPWAFEFHGKQFNWPLTITVNSVAAKYLNEQAQFEFDTASPQSLMDPPNPPGFQLWENLNIKFELAGHPVRVLKVIRTPNSYQVNFESMSSTFFGGVDITIGNSTQGLTGIDSPKNFVSEAKFAGAVPTGKMTALLSHPVILESGNWQLQWQPDHAPTLLTPTTISSSAPQACLTIDSWQVALANPAPIPADFSGKIILSEGYNVPAGYSGPLVYIANLDGSNKQGVGFGSLWVLPSPDGSQVVYKGENGLYIENIATGETHQIPNTTPNDKTPYWSPDGTRIAFARIDEPNHQPNLYTIHPDGTDIRRVIDGVEYEMLIGWFPDSSALLYILNTQNGSSIKKLDLASGASSDLFTAMSGINTSLSPNGNEIAFGDVITDATYGLYVSSLNGSDRRLIALTSDITWDLSSPVWSPDGKWLAINISIGNAQEEVTAALVNLQTCQIVPLPFNNGSVLSWIP